MPDDRATPDRPFFLVGCPRSGTTLLQRMLDAHPVLCVAPETFFVRRFWRTGRRRGAPTDLERVIDGIVEMPEFRDMGLDVAAYNAAVLASDRSYASLFGLLLEMFRHLQGAARVGEKTPNHLLAMPTLRSFFPDARFVHLVRDPRAVVNSWRTVPWSTGRVAGDAEVWRRSLARARADGPALGDALLVIRYETLVETPENTLRGVCAHLEVDFDPVTLTHAERESAGVDVQREPWKEGSAVAVTSEPVDRWRRELTPAMVAAIEAVAGREMARWGYTPETKASLLHPAAVGVALRRPLHALSAKFRGR